MATSTAQRKATDKYISEKLDEIKIRVPKGMKNIIEEEAKRQGDSTNKYIKKAVKNQYKADTGKDIEL